MKGLVRLRGLLIKMTEYQHFLTYFHETLPKIAKYGFLWHDTGPLNPFITIENFRKFSSIRKCVFGSRKSLFGPFLLYIYTLNLYCKLPISAIPGRTLTRISRARIWILTFRKNRWLRIEKHFEIRSTCIFDPGPPLPPWEKLAVLFSKVLIPYSKTSTKYINGRI